MKTTSQRKAEVGISEDWELQVRAYLSMMGPEEKADMIARLRRLISEWEEESGLSMLKYQTN